MVDKQYLNFDISIAAAKRRTRAGSRRRPGLATGSGRACDHAGCQRRGEYKAPASPDNLNTLRWFCKQHIGQYNLKWNFFKNRVGNSRKPGEPPPTDEELRREHQSWISDAPGPSDAENGRPFVRRDSTRKKTRRLTPKEKRALNILNLDESCWLNDVRRQYRSLVKDLHPDRNDGDRSDEDRLNEVMWAWNLLKRSRNFRG